MKNNNKIFLDKLPRKGKYINWKNSIGYKVKFIYKDIQGEIEIVNYNKETQILNIKYLNKEPYDINPGDFKKCQLGKLLGFISNEFKIKIGQIFKDSNRDITIIDRKYIKDKHQNWKYYKYKCNKCGFECGEHYRNREHQKEYWIEENSLLKGHGCACCCSNPQITVPGINDIPTTTPWMVKYFQNPNDAKLYTRCSGEKFYPVCPDCGKIKDKPIKIYSIFKNHSIGCNCSDGQSYPNKLMTSILEQLGVNFISEYSPEWISPKRYDFYFKLNNKKYIIEMDGGWHKENNTISGQTKEESEVIDDYKDNLADEHNIEVIRIDCQESELESIKDNILKSELNNLFNLLKIDWIKCQEFALSNLVKKVCELKRDNPNMTTTNIGKIMKLNPVTIIKYLKKGSKIWNWINYDPKEEQKKIGIKLSKSNNKPVEILKDGISLGNFESCMELERKSEEIFGIKLLQSKISLVCNGKNKMYKKFTFKYII